MHLLSVREEAEIRRGAYIAVLRGELSVLESHGQFAERIKTARVYVEQLLRDVGGRTPGRQIANAIVEALPLDRERREDLLFQMQLAAERRLDAHRTELGTALATSSEQQLSAIRDAHWVATYASSPERAGRRYRELGALAQRFLLSQHAARNPLDAVEVCLVLHDVLSVLNQPGEALVHAKTAGRVVTRLDHHGANDRRARIEHLRVNAPLAEAASLIALGLPKLAEIGLIRAEAAMANAPMAAAFWAPHVARNRLAALSERNRFSLYVAEELARRVKELCGGRAGLLDPQFTLQADVALARAYLRYGSDASRRKAVRLLRTPIATLDSVAELGAVKRSVAMRTYADACLATGRQDEGEHYLAEAWRVAQLAGLEHQLASMRRQFGPLMVDRLNAMS